MSFADSLRQMTASKKEAQIQERLEKAKQAMNEQQIVLEKIGVLSEKIIERVKHDAEKEAIRGISKINKSYGFYGEEIEARYHQPPKWGFDELAKNVRIKLEQEGFKTVGVSWRHCKTSRGEYVGYYLDIKAKW